MTLLLLLLLGGMAQQHEGPSSNVVTQESHHSALHTIHRLIQVSQQQLTSKQDPQTITGALV
jgi:hypothetical protein